MNFYEHQAAARRSSRWLVVAFGIAVLAVVAALDLVLFSILSTQGEEARGFAPLDFAAQYPRAALLCTLFVAATIGLASLYKSLQLRGGGGVVAQTLGGVRVERDTADLRRKRLHNVVEEMAIASGVPMPEVYVLEQEPAINAFAAGHTPANAAVAVTQGALDRLDREQLQGVIAHEFSHILNGDMRLNIQLMGWVFGLLVVALIGRTILRIAPRGRRGGGGILFAALAVMVLGYIGLFAGRILQAAVARHRERLADASAVQFTRDAEGLKGALIKIAGLGVGSHLQTPQAEQAAHFFFAQGLKRLFATHPPLIQRIRALDPRFDVRDLERLAAESVAASLASADETHLAATVAHAAPLRSAAITPEAVAAQVGQPQLVHIREAQALRLALPESLREFVESSGRARALVFSMLLSRDARIRERQIAALGKSLGETALASVVSAARVADDLQPMLRLPALLQIFPALRRLDAGAKRSLARMADDLIRADARISVFEFCLARLFATLVEDELDARPPHGTLSLADVHEELRTLFCVLARAGAKDDDVARRAYEAGLQSVLPMRRPAYGPIDDWAEPLEKALRTLERLQPFAKQAVVEGLVRTIAHDDWLSVDEAELLRTVCAMLHCPLPPLGGDR